MSAGDDRTAETVHTRAATRVWVASACGIAAFGIAIVFTAWQIAIMLAWIAAAGVFLAWVWLNVRHADARRTEMLATREDPSRIAADLLLVGASGASIVAVALALLKASTEQGTAKTLVIAVAGVTLVVSWTTANIVFTQRYASLYYGDVPGGIEFGGSERPTYADFAYLAFTIGMTYQVSDTQLSARAMRKTALRHALLSFVFVTSVIAMAINIVAQLFTG
jgi:uncharacterized membrane protein